MQKLRNDFGFSVDLINSYATDKQKELISSYEDNFNNKVLSLCNEVLDMKKKIIMLSGPSSSGKTTTSFKIKKQFDENNHTAITVSLDNFFKNKSEASRDENGNYDFESVNALDVSLIREKLTELVRCGCALLPVFDFLSGTRDDNAVSVTLPKNGIIIVEGIHALNSVINDILPKELVFKLYISVHTDFSSTSGVLLQKRDVRLLRRIVRDFKYRGSSCNNTLSMWDNVCFGEDKYIRPNAKYADTRLDTCFPFEVGILKETALELLSTVSQDSENYKKAKELTAALQHFNPFDEKYVDNYSLIREFIGGSSFKY
jgi:uridine kinase